MDQTDNGSRELKKSRLRQRVYETSVMQEISEAEQAVRRKRRSRILFAVILIALALLIAAGLMFIKYRKHYTSYSIAKAVQVPLEGESVEAFGSGAIRWSANGAAYMNADGKTVWDVGYSMRDPRLTIGGEYGMIADRGGQTAVIFSETGVSGNITTSLPINGSCLSHYGVAAFMLDSGDSSLITFYDRTGRRLDIEIKNVLAEESGFPVDFAISPKGTGMLLSLLFMDSGCMQTRLSFMNFDTGKDASDRVVGLFEYDRHLYPDVRYLTDSRAVAFGDCGMEFFSLGSDGTPRRLATVEVTETIESVFSCEDRVGIICRAGSGGHVMTVYDIDGEKIFSRNIGFEYTQASFSGRYVIVANEATCLIMNKQGRVTYEGTFAGRTYRTVDLGLATFLQMGDYGIREVRLK